MVTGGMDQQHKRLNWAERYDHANDRWLAMPSMIRCRGRHYTVAARQKLCVFGDGAGECKVFDDVCGSFVSIKSPPYLWETAVHGAVAFGGVIAIFQSGEPYVACYDVDGGEWSKKPCATMQTKERFSCVKVPWFLETVSI